MENMYSKEDFYLYVRNGGNLDLMTNNMEYTKIYLDVIPQQYINELAEKGGRLNGFTPEQIKQIPQDSVNKYASRSLQWYLLTPDQIKNIPQNIVNEYVKNGGLLTDLTDKQLKNIPQDIVNEYVANGGLLTDLTEKQLKNIPQDYIEKRAKKGYSLYEFSELQKADIPQDIINIYASKGGQLINEFVTEPDNFVYVISLDQIKKIPLEIMYEYVANGGDMCIFTESQIKEIPQNYINRRAENGYDLDSFDSEQIKNIPLDSINKRIEEGGNFKYFSEDKIFSVDAINFNRHFSDGFIYYFLSDLERRICLNVVPKEISYISKNGLHSLILYTIDKMKVEDLPVNVFVNNNLRTDLLNVLKTKTTNKFNKMCKEKGYVNSVPPKVQKAFDEKLKSYYAYVERRKEEGLKQLSDMSEKKLLEMKSEEEKLSQNSLNFINNWEM